jgi:hypothetical protein
MHCLNFPAVRPLSRQKNIIAIKYKFMQEKNKKIFIKNKRLKKRLIFGVFARLYPFL